MSDPTKPIAPYQWKPGQRSPNPGGRPKGAAGLAKYIREQTNNCQELVDTLLTIARSSPSEARKKAACEALLDRAIGKPLVSVDLQAEIYADGPETVAPRAATDLSKLNDAEFAAFRALMLKAARTNDPVDV